MFTLEKSGLLFWKKVRLIAPDGIDRDGFEDLARQLGTRARRARKSGLVAARQAAVSERIDTRWNGNETTNTAEPGDWIVTALANAGSLLRDGSGEANTYVIKAQRFPELYDASKLAADGEVAAAGAIYEPKGVVDALPVNGGFEIKAPWGETQRAASGYILRNGNDVYGNNRETFEHTYKFID